jgi:hypothetical protein
MQSHFSSRASRIGSRFASRCAPFVAVFALTAQVIAQNPIVPRSAGQSDAAIGSQQATITAPAPPEISAPEPAQEEANLSSSSQAIPFLALEAGQDSSQSTSQGSTTTVATQTAPKKPAHRGLGITLIVVGSLAAAAGIAAYVTVTGPGDICSGASKSGNCNTAHTATLVLIPVGAGIAATGLFFTFHR